MSVTNSFENYQWKIGSLCEIYSNSRRKWFTGRVIKITVDDKKNRWLKVEYNGSTTKRIQVLNKNIKPFTSKRRRSSRKSSTFNGQGIKKRHRRRDTTLSSKMTWNTTSYDHDTKKYQNAISILHPELQLLILQLVVPSETDYSFYLTNRVQFSGIDKFDIGLKEYTKQSKLEQLEDRKEMIFRETLYEIMASYVSLDMIDIIISFHGPLVYPIRCTVDLLPFFDVKIGASRQSTWLNARRLKKRKYIECNVHCEMNLIEDIYFVFAEFIRRTLQLRTNYNEQAVLKIESTVNEQKIYIIKIDNQMAKDSVITKQFFTKLYLRELCNFKNIKGKNWMNMKFNVHLLGIDYFEDKREFNDASSL